HGTGEARNLLSAAGAAALADLREILRETPGVHLDPAHEHSVRAYRLDADGKAGLDPATIETALARAGRERLQAIPARSQTDFVAAEVDKGVGVQALAELLGEPRLALAVGDSAQDLPMLVRADRAAAPANADGTVRAAAIPIMRRPYGAGLVEAVSPLLGHPAGGCAVCAPVGVQSDDAAVLLAVLGALDGGAQEKALQAVRLATRLAAR